MNNHTSLKKRKEVATIIGLLKLKLPYYHFNIKQ